VLSWLPTFFLLWSLLISLQLNITNLMPSFAVGSCRQCTTDVRKKKQQTIKMGFLIAEGGRRVEEGKWANRPYKSEITCTLFHSCAVSPQCWQHRPSWPSRLLLPNTGSSFDGLHQRFPNLLGRGSLLGRNTQTEHKTGLKNFIAEFSNLKLFPYRQTATLNAQTYVRTYVLFTIYCLPVCLVSSWAVTSISRS
jgi:hypothetical protein